MKVQAVQEHPWASVGALLSPRGVDESPEGVPRAGGVQEVYQSVAQPGVAGGLLLAAGIVKVFIGHWLRHSRTVVSHGLSLSGKGWCGPWCRCHGVVCSTVRRLVSRCRRLAVRSMTMLLGGDCSWTWAALEHAMGL